ncbi:MAG: hypothetical protein HQL68_06240 [Magnetococcales bacterium]|nr:hypothetical protein [Magnetococcales bacterium]
MKRYKKAKPWEALQAPNPHAFKITNKSKTLGFAKTHQGNDSPGPALIRA